MTHHILMKVLLYKIKLLRYLPQILIPSIKLGMEDIDEPEALTRELVSALSGSHVHLEDLDDKTSREVLRSLTSSKNFNRDLSDFMKRVAKYL